jgi:hypothetical protein
MAHCPYCGAQVAADTYYCVHCRRNAPLDANGHPQLLDRPGGNVIPYESRDAVPDEAIGFLFYAFLLLLALGAALGVLYGLVRFVKWAWMD